MRKLTVYTDGGASPNPGPASIGAVLKDESGAVIGQVSKSIGFATNNAAEYQAVIAALELASELGAERIEIRSDSEWLVRQINGQYKVRTASIRPFYLAVKQAQTRFKECVFKHIPRELNEAHALADQAG